MRYLLALDQGTSSSRSLVFGADGTLLAMAQQELTQKYPQPGWVEHDPMEIWRTQLTTARTALAQAGIEARDLAAVGITNQRETTLLWDRRTGEPLHNAIVWQDRRSTDYCNRLRQGGLQAAVSERTGLIIDPYFSGTKLQWLLDTIPDARAKAENGDLAFGTVDSWLIWQLTGGAQADSRAGAVHATDVSNASRTMLFNVHTNQWDDALLQALNIPHALLPRVQPSASLFGCLTENLLGHPVPIASACGDQQSALFGQACLRPGMVKNTYGTGCFMLMHTGRQFRRSEHALITTSAAQTTSTPEFALEGSVFVGGAVVQWLRDGLHAIRHSSEVQALAESVPDNGGVMIVPAFTGLGAPYWRPDARGTISGLTRGSSVAHIARAALESIAFQSAALLQAMRADAGLDAQQQSQTQELQELRVDGGACVNDLLMQFQADLLGISVLRPAITETTAFGAACLAGLTTGVYRNPDEIAAMWRVERRFEPRMPPARSKALMERWEQAVQQAIQTPGIIDQ